MGYNYSLAEYIDLKETNISVYIKRGVYDDEIADDFDWRRSGGAEPSIALKDAGGQRISPGVQQGEQPLAAGRRRSDNSIFESEAQNKYEGSLMRLTSPPAGDAVRRFEPPAPPYTTSPSTTLNKVDALLQVADSLPGGSVERLKAIQAAARHHEARKIELATAKIPEDPLDRVKAIEANAQIHNARRSDPTTTTDKYAKYFGQLAMHPGFPGSGLSARKFMESRDKDIKETIPPNRFRDAVFQGDLSGWPTAEPSRSSSENFFDYEVSYKSPVLTPPTIRPLLVRPLENKMQQIMWDMKPKVESPIKITQTDFKDFGNDNSIKLKDMVPKRGKMYSDYDDSHGLPIRRKRSGRKVNVKESGFISSLITKTTHDTYLHTKAIEEELEISTITEDTLLNDFIQKSSAESTKTKLNNLKSTNSSHNSQAMIVEADHDSDVFVKLSKINSLEHLTSTWKTKYVNSKPTKRKKKLEGYAYKILGNKQTESFWWRFSDGVSEQWNRIILYLHKRNSPILDHFRNPKSSDNNDSNSFDSKKSTIINKLVAISTKKPVERNQFHITETNTGTNLDI